MAGIRALALALMGLSVTGCPTSIADLTWTGYGDPGVIQSAEWIRYRTTSDITFTGELTLSFFVLTNVPDFCGAYQQAVGESFGAFEDFTAARQPYMDADDLRNPEVCDLTTDYLSALASATAPLTQEGAFYLNASFGFGGGGGIVIEEGQPQEGIFEMSSTPLIEDGDFFRTYVRFYEDNPYQLMVDELDCSDPNWGEFYERLGYTEFVGEPRLTGDPGTLQSEIVDDTLVHIAHHDVLTVDRSRTSAGVVNSNAEYLRCDISTHEFFLRIFER